MKAAFLLVGAKAGTLWSNILRKALSEIGELQILSEKEALRSVSNDRYRIVFIDSNEVDDVPSLVSRLRSKQPGCRIVAVTASPIWRRAREALMAGAADYIRKSMDKNELRLEIQRVLDNPPPLRPTKKIRGR